jgi:hypothetical protein
MPTRLSYIAASQMAHESRPPEHDRDGVRVSETPGLQRAAWVLALVTLVIGIGTFLVITLIRRGAPEPPVDVEATRRPEPTRGIVTEQVAPPFPASAPAPGPRPHAVRHEAAPSPTAGAAPPSEPRPPRDVSAKDAIETLNAGGVHTGIAAFPPPGTKPVKRGIVVPDDFALPEGFVRHYQATDDGRQLAPILMLHPDYDLVDARGERVALPDDRVVPPELAPADMPVQILELPAPQAASDREN